VDLSRPAVASLGVGVGPFGLLNLNEEFTPATPLLGVTPAVEWSFGSLVWLGAEVGCWWGGSERAERPRLLLDPALRARLSLPLVERLRLDLILAVGGTLWPEDDAEHGLDPRLDATRLGWSLRAAAGLTWALDSRWRVYAEAGYGVRSTWGDDLAATLDSMQVAAGVRMSL